MKAGKQAGIIVKQNEGNLEFKRRILNELLLSEGHGVSAKKGKNATTKLFLLFTLNTDIIICHTPPPPISFNAVFLLTS